MLKSEPKYEEEPMDTGELLYDEYDEEGEIHSSDEQSARLKIKSEGDWPVNFISKFSGYTDEVNSVDEFKKLQRAKRFAIPLEESKRDIINRDHLPHLYKSLGINNENERHYRFNAVHMRGTQDMSTEDVLEYFSSFTPLYIEWINDVSCNVVWTDDISAARALLNLSKEIINLDKIHLNANPFVKDLKEKDSELLMASDIQEDAVDAREIKAAIPPGFWRIGVPSTKSQVILLRFATRSDRKQKNAEKNSEYYKRYGNPHFGNLPGLVSKSLRSGVFKKYRNLQDDEDNLSGEGNSKKNPWGNLAEEWNKQDRLQDVRSKISLKRSRPNHQIDLRMSINNKQKYKFMRQAESSQSDDDYDNGDEDEDNYDNSESRVKFPRMKMYADDEDNINSNSNKLSSQVRAPVVEDLRNKIDRRRRNKEMLSSRYKGSTSRRHWNKFNNAVSYDNNDTDEDEEKNSSWALEQYSDLRESLEQNKKLRNSKHRSFGRSDSDESDNFSNDTYNGNFGQRSPLQIEIENDEYFDKESNNTL